MQHGGDRASRECILTPPGRDHSCRSVVPEVRRSRLRPICCHDPDFQAGIVNPIRLLYGCFGCETRPGDGAVGAIAFTLEVSSNDGSSRHYKCGRRGTATTPLCARAHDRNLLLARHRDRRIRGIPRRYSFPHPDRASRGRIAKLFRMGSLCVRNPGEHALRAIQSQNHRRSPRAAEHRRAMCPVTTDQRHELTKPQGLAGRGLSSRAWADCRGGAVRPFAAPWRRTRAGASARTPG